MTPQHRTNGYLYGREVQLKIAQMDWTARPGVSKHGSGYGSITTIASAPVSKKSFKSKRA